MLFLNWIIIRGWVFRLTQQSEATLVRLRWSKKKKEEIALLEISEMPQQTGLIKKIPEVLENGEEN